MTNLTEELLIWYRQNGRDLPWRVKGGAHENAYLVWVSEIMLQQTTVQTVYDYFNRWMKRFPDLKTLAEASLDDVLHMWQGLGYYTRAKKMHECAHVLMKQYGGRFPADREALLKLPGIGPYTASSICAFAFNLPETVVDGNVIRVIARLYGITTEIDKDDIYQRAQKLTSLEHGADYASAIMDLGATVCKPQGPLCMICPWVGSCQAAAQGIAEEIPVLKKLQKKKKHGAVFVIHDGDGRIFISKRAGKGLLSGLWELPWTDDGHEPPFEGKWVKRKETVRHVFTHFDLTLDIYETTVDAVPEALADGTFVHPAELAGYAFSTLMKKVLKKI